MDRDARWTRGMLRVPKDMPGHVGRPCADRTTAVDCMMSRRVGYRPSGGVYCEGADRAGFAIRSALELRAHSHGWDLPVLLTVASQGKGVRELVDQFEAHLVFLQSGGLLEQRRRERLDQRIEELVLDELWDAFEARVSDAERDRVLEEVVRRRLTPRQAAEQLARPEGGS